MKVRDLPADEFRTLARNGGAPIRIGPSVLRLRTPYRILADGVHLLYADFPLEPDATFADIHVEIRPPRGLRRWYRPQALFFFDGEPLFAPYPGRLTLPLLEWGLNWCTAILSQQYLIIHSAVLERDGCAVILPAKPGSGKSTLCAALAHRGWRLLSDEMALVRPGDGLVDPMPRPVGLKNASIEVIRTFVPDAVFGPLWEDTKKGTVTHLRPPRESVERAAECARPAWIVFPTWREGAPAAFTAHPKAEAMMRIADNSMNYPGLGATGFETLGRLVEGSRCLEFSYGRLEDAMEAFAALDPREPA